MNYLLCRLRSPLVRAEGCRPVSSVDTKESMTKSSIRHLSTVRLFADDGVMNKPGKTIQLHIVTGNNRRNVFFASSSKVKTVKTRF